MRKPLVLLSVMAVFVGAGVVALPYLMDVNRYKPQITALIEEHAHRKVRLEGDIDLRLFPSLALKVTDLHLLEADGKTDLVHIGKLTLLVELWPLLKQQVKVDSLILDDVDAFLKIDKNGTPNWEATVAEREQQSVEGKDKDEEVAENNIGSAPVDGEKDKVAQQESDAALVLKEVIIRNAELDFQDKQVGRRITLNNLALAADFADGKSNLDVSGKVVGLPKELQDFSLVSSIEFNAGTSVQAKDTKFKLGKINGTSNFLFNFAKKVKQVEGGIYLNDADITPYVQWWQTGATGGSAPVAKAGAAAAGRSAVALSDASAAKKVPHSWSSQPIDVSVLRLYSGHFGLYFDGLKYENYQLGKGDIYAHLQYGNLSLKVKELALLEGNLQGEVKAMLSPNGMLDVGANLKLADIELGALPHEIKALAYEPSGKVGFDINVKSKGNNQKALVSALAGKADLNVANAEFQTLGDALQEQLGDPLISHAIAPYRKSFGNIAQMSAHWDVAGGVFKNKDFRMQSSPVSFLGEGEINLPDYQLYYRFVPVRTGDGEQVNFAGVKLPDVLLKGAIDAPKVRLDAGDTVRGLIEKGLSDGGVKEIKRDLIDKRREVVDELKKGLEKNGLKNLLQGF